MSDDGEIQRLTEIERITDFPDVESVLEQMGERTNAETNTAPLAAIGTSIGLGLDAAPIEILDQRIHRAKFEILCEDGANRLGFLRQNHELLVNAPIAERDRSADPDALAL